MKNKNKIWYVGYILSVAIVLIIFFTNFPKTVDIGLAVLFSAIFSVSHTQLLHSRLMKNDADYRLNVMDERNILIKEKAGNITNMLNMVLLGLITVVFIALDYVIPAIITGVVVAVQPIILIIISNMIEKKIWIKDIWFFKNILQIDMRKNYVRTKKRDIKKVLKADKTEM